MIAVCPAVPTGSGFLSGLLTSLDCWSFAAAQKSFAFLGSAGGPGAILLLAALTLLIAVFGYRMIFGPQPDLGDAGGAALKIGMALALASSWPVVSKVIAGPVIHGPAELAAWTGAGLNGRLGQVDDGIAAVTSWGTGRYDIRSARTADGSFTANSAATVPLADSLAYSGARLSFLLTAIGSIGLLSLLSGILLGLAPVFAGLLLFERTKGLFIGWARALFALVVAGVAIRITLSLELTLLEPWLAEVVRQRQAFQSAPSSALELFAITLAFGLIAVGIIALIFRICLSIELPIVRVAGLPIGSASSFEAAVYRQTEATRVSGMPVANDRLMGTVSGLERVDAFRKTTTLIGRGASVASVGAPAVAHYESRAGGQRSRMGRTSLMAGRRDLKARRT